MFTPKLMTTFKSYNASKFLSDLTAGVIVGIVAIPLAVAFAIASGVSPEKGLYTAIVAGLIISAFGGSQVQIGGPTGAFVVIVYGIVQKYGLDGLTVATIMAGIILIIMGVAKLGSLIKFIPHPVVAGFTSGIAVTIFSTQIKDLFGLEMGALPAEFIPKWAAYFANFGSLNYYAVAISLLSLLLIIFWQKIFPKIPGALLALVVATVVATVFKLPVETIGSRYGVIPATLPMPQLPQLNFNLIQSLLSPAFTIAILAAIEALLSAVVADGMISDKHHSDTELIANGLANVVAPLFGGIPATGAIARTATNIKNGGRTPIAGIIHALTLFLIMMFFGKWASNIPLSCLAAVLVVVSYNMCEWRSFVALLKSPRSDVIVLLLTFGLTVIFDLTIAIEVGMVMAVFLFMRRMSQVTQVSVITDVLKEATKDETELEPLRNQADFEVPEGVQVYEINGPFFFGAVYKFDEIMEQSKLTPEVLVIRMRNVPAIDSTGLRTLVQFIKKQQHKGVVVVLSGVQAQPKKAMAEAGLLQLIGSENVYSYIYAAMSRARQILASNSDVSAEKAMV